MRRLLALVAAVVVALVAPAAARSHVLLVEASPAQQSTIAAPPAEIRLRFSESVTVVPGAVQVLASDGTVLSGTVRVSGNGRLVTTRLSRLTHGSAYTVRWRVTGADGHSPAGVFTFGIGVAPPPPTEAVGARGTTWKDDLARWALFVALALVIGPLTVRLLVLHGPLSPRLESVLHVVPTVAALAVINIGIAAFILRASNALRLPIADLLYGDLQPFAERSRFGVAFLSMTFGFGVVTALLMLAWIFDWVALRWPAFGLSALLASGLSLSSHQATEPNSTWLSELADWLHLVAACVWVGGLATLAFLVWPLVPSLRRRAFLGFSRLALALVAVMVLAGAYLALVRLPQVADLWETDYGRLLLLKAALVSFALAWGGFHHLVVRPRLEAGEQPDAQASLVGESAVALAVLLAAAALTNGAPPPVGPASSPAATGARSGP